MKLTDVLSEEDFIFAICKFLEEFKQTANKKAMIDDEPKDDCENVKLCILAAVVHKLADDFGLDVPAWVNKPNCFLQAPIFSFDTKNKEYQEYLRENTPYEFAMRNIYYGANVIERI